MFEKISYKVEQLDGDYAYLSIRDEEDSSREDWKCVARALLPTEIEEGSCLDYEMLEYKLVQ